VRLSFKAQRFLDSKGVTETAETASLSSMKLWKLRPQSLGLDRNPTLYTFEPAKIINSKPYLKQMA
jgi:hypothetical protein